MKKEFIGNTIFSLVILFTNIFLFLPLTITIIVESGGPMGYGFTALPLLLTGNSFVLSAFYVLTNEERRNKWNNILILGAIYCIGLSLFILKAKDWI